MRLSRFFFLVISLLFVVNFTIAQVGIGTENPHPSAALDLTSTTQGFLPPRVTQEEIYFFIRSSPAEGLLVYCTDCVPKGVYTFSNSSFKYIFSGKPTETIAQPVVSESGLIWMDRNLGATRIAESPNDQRSWGYMYQWGRGNDGHEIAYWIFTEEVLFENGTTNVKATSYTPNHGNFITSESNDGTWTDFTPGGDGIGEDDLWKNGINNPCPTEYRVPTYTELEYETRFFSEFTLSGAFNSPLKFTQTKSRNYISGEVSFSSRYWTSTVSASRARSLNMSTSGLSFVDTRRARGASVRCISDATPETTVTSSTGQVWMDRNLGANRVAQSSTDFEGYGDLYQWGRKKDGHEVVNWISSNTGTVTPTTTNQISNATTESSEFVVGHPSWTTLSSVDYYWKNGVNNPCPPNFRVPTAVEFQKEVNEFQTNNGSGAFNSVLKLPIPGSRNATNGSLENSGATSYYWTSNVSTSEEQAGALLVNTAIVINNVAVDYASGMSVRCIYDPNQENTIMTLTGKTWMNRNLGANRQALSVSDYESYGSLYQWGRSNDGHQIINWASSTTTDGVEQSRVSSVVAAEANPNHSDFITTLDNSGANWTSFTGNNLWEDGINDPCPEGYHVPTASEFQEEINKFHSQDIYAAFSILRLPTVGFREGNSSIVASEEEAFYWTSTVNGSNSSLFQATTNSASVSVDENDSFNRSRGLAIRCVKTE